MKKWTECPSVVQNRTTDVQSAFGVLCWICPSGGVSTQGPCVRIEAACVDSGAHARATQASATGTAVHDIVHRPLGATHAFVECYQS